MPDLSQLEYAALRHTISSRGTARVVLAVVTVAAWATTLVAVLALLPYAAGALIPLLILVTGFEAIRMLHLGVERVGRFLQVHYEPDAGLPGWEHAAMRLGPSVPGAGGHPLFLPLYWIAIVVNLLAVWAPGPLAVEVATLGGAHAVAAIWGLLADRAMRRQRSQDLEAFQATARR
jgi:hypothetical protein